MPRIAALVLAAGRSSRMHGANKLLATVAGIPLVVRAVNAALASRASSVTVVTGHAAEQVERLVDISRVSIVRNPDYAKGISSSLRLGIATLPTDAEGVVVLLGDMPFINATHIDILVEEFSARPAIIVPMKDGRRGNPILWPRSCFSQMQSIQGDQGASQLLTRTPAPIVKVEMTSEAIFADIDTSEMLAAINAKPHC